jgi:hypothetical protein
MPIATCYIVSTPDHLDPDDIIARWSRRSGIESSEMTINLIPAHQGGKRYAAMAWLYLPSLWSGEEVAALSEGLATALADALTVDPSAVQVLTSIVPSGLVIEGGKSVRW